MTLHIVGPRQGFGFGFTEIVPLETGEGGHGIAFGALRLAPGEKLEEQVAGETAWLLMEGTARLAAGGRTARVSRRSLFDEGPSCLHVAAHEQVALAAETECEFTVYGADNLQHFDSRLYLPGDVPNEHRGKGQVGDACYRYVRTIFDRRNADPAAKLVLGEVVTMPGRWSSYPPHHHAQPEIYHYRFTLPQGYGHSELGDQVVKIQAYDTVKIPAGLDHAQCAAPGYGMYYSWVICHLPDNPYTVPEFAAAHRWILDPAAQFWQPAGD